MISDLQGRVDSLETRSSINHEPILSLDQKFETMDWKLETFMDGLARRLDGFMLMFSKLPHVSLPPRERSDPLLPGNGVIYRAVGSSKFEVELVVVGENVVE